MSHSEHLSNTALQRSKVNYEGTKKVIMIFSECTHRTNFDAFKKMHLQKYKDTLCPFARAILLMAFLSRTNIHSLTSNEDISLTVCIKNTIKTEQSWTFSWRKLKPSQLTCNCNISLTTKALIWALLSTIYQNRYLKNKKGLKFRWSWHIANNQYCKKQF